MTNMAALGSDAQENAISSSSLYQRMNVLATYAEQLVPDFHTMIFTWKKDIKSHIEFLTLHFNLG